MRRIERIERIENINNIFSTFLNKNIQVILENITICANSPEIGIMNITLDLAGTATSR